MDDVIERGPALVIRSGGGRAGESFPLGAGRLTVGRRPTPTSSSTTSPSLATTPSWSAAASDYYLDDCGSLNGTYVNRRRIESHRLTDGDELQVGKYKLAFLSR